MAGGLRGLGGHGACRRVFGVEPFFAPRTLPPSGSLLNPLPAALQLLTFEQYRGAELALDHAKFESDVDPRRVLPGAQMTFDNESIFLVRVAHQFSDQDVPVELQSLFQRPIADVQEMSLSGNQKRAGMR